MQKDEQDLTENLTAITGRPSLPARGCLKQSDAPDQKSSRRVSFHIKSKVKVMTYPEPVSSNEQKKVAAFTIPDISTNSRKSGGAFALNFADSSNDSMQHSFEVETYEMPLKSGDELPAGEIEAQDLFQMVESAGNESVDMSLESIEPEASVDSIVSPSNSDILSVRSTLVKQMTTPTKVSTPLRRSYTPDIGWTTAMDLDFAQSPKPRQSLVCTLRNEPANSAPVSETSAPGSEPTSDAFVSAQENDDMDMTECLNAEIVVPEKKSRRSSVAAPRMSTASAMDFTECVDADIVVPEKKSRRSSVVPPRMSTASAMDLSMCYGNGILEINTPSPQESPVSGGRSLRATPYRQSLTSRGTSPLLKTDSSKKSVSSRKKTPLRTASSSKKVRFQDSASEDLQVSPILAKNGSHSMPLEKKSSGDSTDTMLSFATIPSSFPTKLEQNSANQTPVASQKVSTYKSPRRSFAQKDWAVEEESFSLGTRLDNNIENDEFLESASFVIHADQHSPKAGMHVEHDEVLEEIPVKESAMRKIKEQFEAAMSQDVVTPDFLLDFTELFHEFPLTASNIQFAAYREAATSIQEEIRNTEPMLDMADNAVGMLTAFEYEYELFEEMMAVARQDAHLDTVLEILEFKTEQAQIYGQTMKQYLDITKENVVEAYKIVEKKQLLDPQISEIASVLEDLEKEYAQLLDKCAEFDACGDEEYQRLEALIIAEEAGLERKKQEILTRDQEISDHDRIYEDLGLQKEANKKLMQELAKDIYIEVPNEDSSLQEAKDAYDLLRKISGWEITKLNSEKATMTYRQGLVTVECFSSGLCQVADSKLKLPLKVKKGVLFDDLWMLLDTEIMKQSPLY